MNAIHVLRGARSARSTFALVDVVPTFVALRIEGVFAHELRQPALNFVDLFFALACTVGGAPFRHLQFLLLGQRAALAERSVDKNQEGDRSRQQDHENNNST